MKLFGIAAVSIMLLGVSGCTELQLGNHMFKKVSYKPAPNHAPPVTGKRKIGNPYTINGVTYYPIPSSEGYRAKGVASWYGSDFHGKKTANGERYNMHALTAAHPTLPLPTWVRVTNLENGRSVRLRVNDRGPFLRGRLIDLSYRGAQMLDMVDAGTAPVLVEALPTNGSPLLNSKTRVASTPQVHKPLQQKSGGGFTHRVAAKTTSTEEKTAKNDVYIPKLEQGERLPPHPTVKPVVLNKVNLYVQTGAFSSAENAERQKEKVAAYYDNAFTVPVAKGGRTLNRVRVGPIHSVKEADEVLAKLVEAGFNTAIIAVD